MSENPNLPAVRTEPPAASVVRRDTDSWADQLPAIVELSRSICGTDFVPEAMRDNVAATAAAILYGREVGLPPMTALGNVNVIKGKPGLSAVVMRAQVLADGHEIRQDASDGSRCVLSGRRRGTDYWQTVTYTIDDARQAGLLRNEQYAKNPRRMLRARATSELCELMFADVVRGMPSLEELEDLDEDTPAGPPAKTARATVQRKRTSKTDDGVVSTPPDAPSGAAPSSPPLPPLPGEEGYDQQDARERYAEQNLSGAEAVAYVGQPIEPSAAAAAEAETGDGAGAPSAVGAPAGEATSTPAPSSPEGEQVAMVDEPRMINRAMQKAMFKVFGDLGITDDTERLHVTAAIVGRTPMHQGKPSSNGLTAAEYQLLVDALARCKTRDHVEALVQMAEDERARAGEA